MPVPPKLLPVVPELGAPAAPPGVVPRWVPVPPGVGVPPIPYLGAAYLGPAHEPFAVHGDPNDPRFEVPNLAVRDPDQRARLEGRRRLQGRLDGLARRAEYLARQGALSQWLHIVGT